MTTTPPARLGTVLGVWAHPDDEAYLMAGTALFAARHGSPVACLTATAGEAGETADAGRWPQRDLARIRKAELQESLAILGIEDHVSLGLPDGGLPEVDPTLGIDLVAAVVDRVKPDTILTFGPDGVTGHPDHVTIGQWASRAAAIVRGDRCRVFAVTKTPDWLDRFAEVNHGIIASPPPRTPPDDLALHIRLPERDLDLKIRALRAQASQTAGLIEALGEQTYRMWLADEYWVDRTVQQS